MKAPRLFSGFRGSDHLEKLLQEASVSLLLWDLQKQLLIYVMNQVMKEGTEINGEGAGVLGDPNWLSKSRKSIHPVGQLAFHHGPKSLLS